MQFSPWDIFPTGKTARLRENGGVLVRKQIEIARSAILRELVSPVVASRELSERRIRESWGVESALVTLSVRSAFDLFLAERAWPDGSEIVMSGANVPDMATIARHHGLRVRAVDFELSALAPDVAAFDRAIRPCTRAIVFAHLFGSYLDLTSIADLARRRGLDLVEDAAQAFDGDSRGHPNATLSMFSFGPIKSASVLGGAVSTIRDPVLARRLRERLARQTVASGLAFRRRLAKYFALITMSQPRTLGFLARRLARRGCDLDDFLAGSARSFAGRDLIFAIREQASRPLLRLLARRLRTDPLVEISRRAEKGAALASALRGVVDIPSNAEATHSYWVFPMLCDNPAEFVSALRAQGFDATRRATLAPIGPDLPRLGRAFERLVYLPFAVGYSEAEIDRMIAVVRMHARVIRDSRRGVV